MLKRGYGIALSLSAVGVLIASRCLLYTDAHPDAWWKFAACGFLGLCNAILFLQIAQYYTDYQYEPVRRPRRRSIYCRAMPRPRARVLLGNFAR